MRDLDKNLDYTEELDKKVDCLDKLIDNYSLLHSNSTNDISYELIIEMLLNQKVKIKQLICDIGSKKEFERETRELLKNLV